jgi:hypothetical protein
VSDSGGFGGGLALVDSDFVLYFAGFSGNQALQTPEGAAANAPITGAARLR